MTLKRLILKLWPRVLKFEITKNWWTSRSINLWNILQNIIKSALIRRHSKISFFKSFNRSLYERCCKPCNLLVKRRWMFSKLSIRPRFDGDQTKQQYSSSGLTYAIKLWLINICYGELKQLRISAARYFAFVQTV